MRQIKSGVFFIDILGFSALTKGQIEGITAQDYQAWGLNGNQLSHSFLSAKIILEFRLVLMQLKQKYPSINIGQLSDCAFIWSSDILLLLQAVHFMMWTMIKEKGILCRGGISYGEIVEINNVDYNLGAFIVGSAVTNAVKNEGRLKGPRISMDLSITDQLLQTSKRYSTVNILASDLFHPIESMIDMNIADEYRWYLCDDDMIASTLVGALDNNMRIDLTKQRLKLSNVIRFHPRMGWNGRSKDGRTQLKAGVKSISANKLLGILHNFEMDDVHQSPRSTKNLKKSDVHVDNDKYYTMDQYDEWKAGLLDLE